MTDAVENHGVNGKNAEERARNMTVALLSHEGYNGSLRYLRECEAAVDRIAAQIAVEEDAIRAAELAAREKLAEALLGKRVDDAVLGAIELAAERRNAAVDPLPVLDEDFPF